MDLTQKRKIQHWIRMTLFGLVYGGSCYLFGNSLYNLQETVFQLFSGTFSGNSAYVSMPVALFLVLWSSSFLALMVRPLKQYIMLIVFGGVCMALGWAHWSLGLLFIAMYVLAAMGHGVFVSHELEKFRDFKVTAAKSGRFFVKLALVFLLCSSVHFGGAQFVQEKGITLPEKEIAQMSEYLGARIPENSLGLSSNQLSGEIQRQVNVVFSTFIKPQEQNLAWAIVFALFIPLLLILVPISWLVDLSLWGLVAFLLKYDVLKKTYEHIEIEKISL